jgi:hypothetical protein
MGKINVPKVMLGGLIAGAVLSIGDVLLYGVVVKAPMAVAMQKLPPMTDAWRSAEVPWYILLDLCAGMLLIWLYAAIRPRFGAGPRTAAIAGFAGWCFAGLLCSGITLPMGLMPYHLTLITTGVMLVEYLLGAILGAWLYTERDGNPAAT